MTDKRFVDDGVEEIENQSFTDNLTNKTYWIDKGLDDIVELLNELYEESQELHQKNTRLNDRIDFLHMFIERQGFKVKWESVE